MAKTMPARMLVVDQDTRYGEWLKHHVGVLFPESPVTVLKLTDFGRWSEQLPGRDFEVLMLSASFGAGPEDPQAQGLELLRQLRDKAQFPAVIAVAEDGNELTAVRALQLGAVDYLPKRLLTPDRLKNSVRLALRLIEKRVVRQESSVARDGNPESGSGALHTKHSSTQGDVCATVTIANTAGPAAQPGTSPESDGPVGANDIAETKEPSNTTGPAGAEEPPSANGPVEAGPAKQPADDSEPMSSAVVPGGEFMPADFIPGYTIHATIGESEKAAVYVATSDALQKNVALKVSKTLREEAAGRQLLEREYRAIAAIRHPSVVQIYDYGVHAEYEYLVMEYLPRGDLKARMHHGLTQQEAVGYVAQIAAALRVIHHAGLLHRDLKPPNVMLRENGDVALIDFGLARALDGGTASTRTGVLRGSPYYMSPEQAMGEVLDARSDFYSLGIMYYEMLTGKKPYTGGSAMDVLQQHVNAPVPMLPKPLVHHEPVLLKLMAKSRDDRFATAEQVLIALGSGHEIPQAAGPDAPQVESSAA